jgi:FeS assembly SUF system regulator
MIKISKLSDYAVVVLSALAEVDGRQMNASGLSAYTGLPEPTVAKVLKLLAREQILVSERGVNGGYKLLISPDRLSIGRIIKAIDGPVSVTSCVDNAENACAYQSRCTSKGRWNKVNNAVRDTFESISLADMMSEPHSKSPPIQNQDHLIQGAAV